MAYFQGAVRSRALDMDTNVNVVLPYDYYDAQGNPKPVDKVLYLLHGLRQNADAWPRLSSAERYANYYGYALIIPEVQRSWYCDYPGGMAYYTYITRELPEVMHRMFRLPQGREITFIGGLSMGGYGALKCALRCPEQYAGAMCFSGGYYGLEQHERLMAAYHYAQGEMDAILGGEHVRAEDSLDHLMAAFPAEAEKPRLYLSCGTEDSLFDSNIRCRDMLKQHGFEPVWEQWSGGHDWTFWDAALSKAMRLFSGR